MARFEFKLPDIGEGIAEAEIVAWHVAAGDVVEEDAPIADVMTDKATVELAAPVSGRILATNGQVGENIPIGSVLAVFETDADAIGAMAESISRPETADVPERAADKADRAEQDARHRPVLASPAVRKRAKDLGIDLALVRPNADNRIRHSDLDAYLRYTPADKVGGVSDAESKGMDRIEDIKVIGLRRRIADNITESKRNIPHFTYVEEIDVTALEALRAAMNAERGARHRLTLLPFLIRALVRVMGDFPMMNAHYDDSAEIISRHSSVHLGLATQTDNGLIVPVIRHAETRDLWDLAAEIARLAEAARQGRARREELSGSTITLTSLGALGGIMSTPVINRPEVAIIGVNRIVERPAIVEGRIEVRKLMNLSSSFDHRVVDGWDAASFIQAIRRLVETPALIFAD